MHKCCICEVPLDTGRGIFWICRDCQEEHDLDNPRAGEWPEWATFLWREEMARRGRQARGYKEYREIVISDLPDPVKAEVERLFYGDYVDGEGPM